MVVSLSASCTSRLYPKEIFPVLISVRGCFVPRAIVQSEEFMSMKNIMTSSGIEPATFQFVAQYIKPLCYRGPRLQIKESETWKFERNCRRQSIFLELVSSSADTKMNFPCTKPKDKLPSMYKSIVWPRKTAYKYAPYSHVLYYPLNLFTRSGFFPSFFVYN
jgi:hypothetical protein